jgi:hypothetical protein
LKLGGNKPSSASMPPAPAAIAPEGGIPPATPNPAAPAGGDDKPFNDEPFNADVEADENSDPKKFIEQLSGKIGQSLRKYTQQQGQPDLELEKFTINSVLGATHTSEMDPKDQDDIINKVKSSGKDDEKGDDKGVPQPDAEAPEGQAPEGQAPEMSEDGESEGVNEGEVEDVNSDNLFVKPKKLDMFSDEAGIEAKVSEGVNKKKSIFVTKKLIESRLLESLNQDTMEEPSIAPSKPEVRPSIKPAETKPSRRNKPFLPTVTPSVTPRPKASMEETKVKANDYEIDNQTFTDAAEQMLLYVKSKGYTVSENEWFNTISNGPRKPTEGKTNKYHIDLLKNGIPVKEKLHAQVYGMQNQYELNMYIN